EKKVKIHLPTDTVIADRFAADANIKTSAINIIPENWMGLDIGESAILEFRQVIAQAKTILWNGPMGVFEMDKFANGTKEIDNSIAKATKNCAYSLVGGGDSVAAINSLGYQNEVSYISTGGGAMLEYLEGKKLPGIQALLS